jgi:hypothetical protein
MRTTFATLMLALLFSAVAFAQDATVAVTAPLADSSLYEDIRAVLVDALLAIGGIITLYLANLARGVIGEIRANQVRKYMDEVMVRIVTTWLGRTKNAQNANTNEDIKDTIIDGAAKDIIKAIPDALTNFKVPLDPTSPKLRDMVEARITEQLLEADPQKTLASPDPHGSDANLRDLDAPYSPPKGKKP